MIDGIETLVPRFAPLEDSILDCVWPVTADSKITAGNTGVRIYTQMFGALSQVPSSPFSRIAVANSSFSLDTHVGCPARCAYCVVGSSARDLHVDSQRPVREWFPRKPLRLFSGRDLINSLFRHPAFIPNRSVVSIATGSSEAFLPLVADDTWEIMCAVRDAGLTNPIWIVTKLGVPDSALESWRRRFASIVNAGVPLILSVTYSAAPSLVEPYACDRFARIASLRDSGIFVSHHYRPIMRGINDHAEALRRAVAASRGKVDAVCIGGLRADPGIALAWAYSSELDRSLLPPPGPKNLADDLHATIWEEMRLQGHDAPLVQRSSEAVAMAVGRTDFNLYRYRPDDQRCLLRLPVNVTRQIEAACGMDIVTLVEAVASRLGLPSLGAHLVADEVRVNRAMPYQVHRTLIHALGHSGIFP